MSPLVNKVAFRPTHKDTLSLLLADLSNQSQQIEKQLTKIVNQEINDHVQKQFDQIIVVKTYVRNLYKQDKPSKMKEVIR